MSVIGHSPLAGASGAAGAAGDPVYVDDVFSTTLYTSNASSNFDGTEQVITTGIDHTEGFLTWIKNRDDAIDHVLFDSERDGTYYPWLYSNSTNPEQDTADIFKSPTTTGFTVKQATSGSGTARTNPTGSKDMVAWTFRKAPKFFDVVTYSGTGSAQNIAHSLGSVPGMIIIHCRDGSHDWEVYHRSIGATKNLHLNNTDAATTDSTVWNNTTPTSSVFTVGTSSSVNQNGHGYVAYIFAHDEQDFGANSDESIIKCGSFTSPSSGSFTVDLGFEPQWLMVKRTSSAGGSWVMRDVMRGWRINGFERLFAESDQAEDGSWTNSTYFPINSTGFSTTTDWVGSNATSIYIAIRRPHKPATAATDVFTPDDHETGNVTPYFKTGGHISDFVLFIWPTAHFGAYFISRLTGKEYLVTSENSASANNNYYLWDYMNGMNSYTSSGDDGYNHLSFKRSAGFCDVVGYTGTGAAQQVNHNLGAVPQLIIVKRRNSSANWAVYSEATGNRHYMTLNGTGAAFDPQYGQHWNNTSPTSSVFSVKSDAEVNANTSTYMAYLFASQDGISKIGSYTGSSGNDVDVDCGFTSGARFVLIKRTNGTGDWYVWDTARGIVSGNDPYNRINTAAQEVTGTDYIDPLNAGFTVTSGAPAGLNTTGGTYLFFAVA